MYNNDLTFSTDGPIMSGTWFNPDTGDSFTVRDSLFEDNQYVVYTMDGRVLRYDQLKNYFQTKNDQDIPKLNKNKQNKENESLPPEVASLIDNDNNDNQILPDDMDMIYSKPEKTLGNLNRQETMFGNSESDQNLLIINKALSKCDFPTFDIKINWHKKFPAKEISMLKELMDIKIEEIINYYINNIDFDRIATDINDEILNNITKNLNVEKDQEPLETQIDDVKESKKSSIKKSSTKKTK